MTLITHYLKRKTFQHGSLTYSFFYKAIPSSFPENPTVSKLYKYIYLVQKGRIPDVLFNDPTIPRASKMRIRNLSKTQKNYLQRFLFEKNYIKKISPEQDPLPTYAEHVYQNFKEIGIPKKPAHDPILNYILRTDDNALAIELPVWKIGKKKFECLTGHVDLIQVSKQENDKFEIRVVDYKPEGEKKFLYPIPQIALYAKMLSEKLKPDDKCSVNCYIFDKKAIWKFSPDILQIINEKLESFQVDIPWKIFY
ncbi:MAG: PD-(D/E)XK nuclease family protein [Promethearchaeota archaeon]